MRDASLSNAQARKSPSPLIDTPSSSPSLALPFSFIAGVVLALVTAFAVGPHPSQTCGATEQTHSRVQHAN
jgi:hypothetical protein